MNHPLMKIWLDPANWKKKRDGYLKCARDCRKVLTKKDGYWRYDIDDPRVKEAVGEWVRKAYRFHEIAMGRKPIVTNIDAEIKRPIYVSKEKKND